MSIHYCFGSGLPGPNILIIWSIHGNEICWSNAIEQLRNQLIIWGLKIVCWSVTCMPYANHKAYLSGKRQDTVNLNRIFGDDWLRETATNDEKVAVTKLKELIQISDFVLDLHSFASWEDIPFIFKDINDDTLDKLLSYIPIKYIVSWWNNLYEWDNVLDSIWYTSTLTKLWCCIECWITGSTNTSVVAFDSIISTLEFFWVLSRMPVSKDGPFHQKKEIRVNTIIRKPKWGYFVKPWKNFDKIDNNTVLWIDIDGKEICSNQNWYIVIPNEDVEEWWEWCYLWTEFSHNERNLNYLTN